MDKIQLLAELQAANNRIKELETFLSFFENMEGIPMPCPCHGNPLYKKTAPPPVNPFSAIAPEPLEKSDRKKDPNPPPPGPYPGYKPPQPVDWFMVWILIASAISAVASLLRLTKCW